MTGGSYGRRDAVSTSPSEMEFEVQVTTSASGAN
jgi:hypothetical protein